MKLTLRSTLTLILLFVLGFIFHFKTLNKFPSNTHAWAQADRYAITQGFVRNHLNFFEPETYVLNPQFPGNWSQPKKKSITAVDFPIHDYVPALIMKTTGINQPWISRLYNLLYSFIGLFALYKLSFLLLKNHLKSLLIIIMAGTSPVFIFYQSNFLPTIPSLSNALLGLYFYFSFLESNERKQFNLSLFFLTLATLSRSTFLIPLVAIYCHQSFYIWLRQSRLLPKLIPVLISTICIVSYGVYNSYLRQQYGSLFLDNLIPASSFSEFILKLKETWNNWFTTYFSMYHYVIFVGLILWNLYSLVFTSKKVSSQFQKLNFFIGILFLGNLFFLVAMIIQFTVHDYYFLDSFYLPFILLLIPLVKRLPSTQNNNSHYLFSSLLILIGITLTVNGFQFQQERHTYGFWDKTQDTYHNYLGSDKILSQLGIDKQKKILILQPYAPNFPFLLMDRKGYSTMATYKERIEPTLSWDFDYLIIQNEFFLSEVYPNYPELIHQFEKIYDNGKISICAPSKNKQSLSHFIGLNNQVPILTSKLNFESDSSLNWLNIKKDTQEVYKGTYSTLLTPEMEYGIAFSDTSTDFSREESIVYFSGQIFNQENNGCTVVVSINVENENRFYKTLELNKVVNSNNEWQPIQFQFNIPKIEGVSPEFKLFFYNGGGSSFHLDECSLSIYQNFLFDSNH